VVAGASHQVVQASAFAAEDEDAVAGEVEAIVISFAPLIQADDPEILALEFFKGAHEVYDSSDAKMLCRAGARLYGHGTERRRPALGKYDAIHSRTIGNSQKRAKVLRVFNTVEGKHQPGLWSTSGRVSRLEQIFNSKEFLRANEGNNSLVRGCFCHHRELIPAFLADPHSSLATLGYEAIKARVMALVGHDHVIEAAASGFQRFLNGMQAIQDIHEG
jgi:hypothetical protein